MPKNTSISLDDRHAAFIESCVKSGDYASADDVIRAGLHLLEEHEAEYQEKVKALNEAIEKGEKSGIMGPIDWDSWLAKRHEDYVNKKAREYHEAKAHAAGFRMKKSG